MNDFNFFGSKTQWPLLTWFGVTHPFFNVTASTIIATWAVLGALVITLLLCRFFFHYKKGTIRFVTITIIKAFMNLCAQTLGTFNYRHFSFVMALFLFILYCNLIGMLPFLEEPTADLNTTLALGTFSFLYITTQAIKKRGIKKYIGQYFEPFFLMLPLNVIGKLASVISISFRLFGNLLGGSVITKIFMSFVGQTPTVWYLAAVPIFGSIAYVFIASFFGIFEGFIQAFVFSMLSLTYLSTEIADER